MSQQAPPPRCRLLKLPPELRLEIYAYVFGHPPSHDHIHQRIRDDPGYCVRLATLEDKLFLVSTDRKCAHRTGLALLLACKTIFYEAYLSFDAHTVYCVDVWDHYDSTKLDQLDPGRISPLENLQKVHQAKLTFRGFRHEESAHTATLSRLLKKMGGFRTLSYLLVDLVAKNSSIDYGAVCEALLAIRGTGPVIIRTYDRASLSRRRWEAIDRLAGKLRASLVEEQFVDY